MYRIVLTTLIEAIIFASCLSLDGGTNTLIKESSNNTHNKKAILFLREGNTTVSDSYQVTITDANEQFDKNKVGNTVIVDGNHGEAILDSSSIDFKWLSSDTLQIDYKKNLRTFIQEKDVAGVTIVYKKR